MMDSERYEQDLARGVEALIAGEPLIFPTDTVYGLGVGVGYAETPEILYDIKQRDHGKPVAWLVGSPESLTRYGKDVPELAQALANAYWPGQLTLIVNAAVDVPEAFQAPGGTIALRMPNHALPLDLIERVGAPLATTSANVSGQESPETFSQLDKRILDMVPVALCDETTERSGIASTIVDCTSGHVVVVREGGISAIDIAALGL